MQAAAAADGQAILAGVGCKLMLLNTTVRVKAGQYVPYMLLSVLIYQCWRSEGWGGAGRPAGALMDIRTPCMWAEGENYQVFHH